jgi:hypothetical protein
MKKNRNPRYAPEFLERKLCPSSFAGNSSVTALPSTPDPAGLQNNPPAWDTSFDAVAGSTLTSNTVYYVAAGVSSDVAPDSTANVSSVDVGIGGPTDTDSASTDPTDTDPASTDPTDTDPASTDPSDTDDGPDPEPDPDADPDNPDPPADPGRPPFVPLPPAPIGPEAQAF